MKSRLIKKKSAVSILLIVLFIIQVGCTNGSKSKDEKNESVTNTPTLESTQPVGSMEPEDVSLSKYKEPIEVTIGQSNQEAVKFTEGESVDDNIHHKFNRDYLNINYKNKWIVDATKAQEKLNLAIASNDLPDVMRVSINQLQTLIKNNQIEDLTEVWAKYPNEKVRSQMEYQNKVAFQPATKDGKVYGIPIARDFGESIGMMYIRQDWLDKLQLKAPTNMSELAVIAKAFVDGDPDGNKVKDTYAIGFDKELGYQSQQPMLTSVAQGFKAYPKNWIKDSSGKLMYGSIQPEMKQVLQLMQDLYKMGAIDPEFAVKDLAKVAEKYVDGKTGIYFGVFSAPIYPLMGNKEKEPNAEWTVLPLPAADGTVAPSAKSFANEWIVVRKGFKYPEAAIKSMNLWAEMFVPPGKLNEEWDVVNKDPKYAGTNINLYALPYNFDSPFQNLKNGENLRLAKKTGDETKLDPREMWILGESKKGGAYGWAIVKTFYEAEAVLADYKNIQYSAYQGAPTASMVSRGPTLDKLELEAFIKITMGAPIDEFDKFVANWKRLGGDQMTIEINEASK